MEDMKFKGLTICYLDNGNKWVFEGRRENDGNGDCNTESEIHLRPLDVHANNETVESTAKENEDETVEVKEEAVPSSHCKQTIYTGNIESEDEEWYRGFDFEEEGVEQTSKIIWCRFNLNWFRVALNLKLHLHTWGVHYKSTYLSTYILYPLQIHFLELVATFVSSHAE